MFFPNIRPAILGATSPVFAIAIDAEEDFDWTAPVYNTPHTTACMRNIRDLQAIFSAYRLKPSYLLTYPVLEDVEVVRIIQRYLNRGECDVGVQLHPWVNPPFEDETQTSAASYSGNLRPKLEAKKLAALSAKFTECFGREPRIYRAGRYGLSEHTAGKLEEFGFEIDTSIAPRTDFSREGGPDYSDYDYMPFWFGQHANLLELPLCRSIVGWGGQFAPAVYQAVTSQPLSGLRLSGPVARARLAERITLSPEGNDLNAMIRLVRRLRRRGTQIFVLSFHSSSLAVGRSPYVRSRTELHHFYDRLSSMLDHLARTGMHFASLAEIRGLMEQPA